MTLSIYTHPLFALHHTGIGHPESAARMGHAMEGVSRTSASGMVRKESALDGETDRIIAKVHSGDYGPSLESACRSGQRLFHTLDNPISSQSHAAARQTVGSALAAARDVWVDRVVDRAFVVARPPGHHAERTQAMGFCFFNTIACVAEYLREQPGIERVFILDWDVHHGNGTQHLFEDREDVFYASIHRFPFYPGTGAVTEVGNGRGKGYTRNVPMTGGMGDTAYLDAFERIFVPVMDEFRPDAILISAGFDAHRRDPLGGMNLTERAFGEMTRRMTEAADRHCHGRLLSLLEGGYDPEGLAASVAEHVEALI